MYFSITSGFNPIKPNRQKVYIIGDYNHQKVYIFGDYDQKNLV